jgi:predicted methyltransferase
MQAVHELRHKCHARELHAQVLQLLSPGGIYLVCDHYLGEGGMANDRLYMTPQEQKDALCSAGFSRVVRLMLVGSLTLFRASP